ncbi:MAG: SHOCT domain-containing protein [Pseudonocardiaceae bacterium]
MSVVDGLSRLAELRERGQVTAAEYDEAKQQLLGASRQAEGATHAPASDGAHLLYRLVASWMRRLAVAMAVIALLFGVVAGWSGVRYLQVSGQAAATKNATIVRGFGVRIPDPRPSIDRAVLEAKATAYGGFAAVTGLIAVGTLIGALLVRPPPESREDPRTGP